MARKCVLGYTVSIRRINDNELGPPKVTLRDLASRSHSEPRAEGNRGTNLWIRAYQVFFAASGSSLPQLNSRIALSGTGYTHHVGWS